MASRRRKPDTGCWPYRNRMEGILCAHCGQTITGTELKPGEIKIWERVANKSANFHLACALKLGKTVNPNAWVNFLQRNPDLRAEVEKLGIRVPDAPAPVNPIVVDEHFAPVAPVDDDIDPEVDIDRPEVTPEPVVAPAPKKPAPELPPWMQGFIDTIMPVIETRIDRKVDEDEVRVLIEKYSPTRREVIEIHDKRHNVTRVLEGHHHPMFKRLVESLDMRFHTMLVGPCASGKTTEIRAAAKAMGYTLYLQGPVATKYDLLGYVDGPGNYHPTPFQQWFTSKEPALLLWDEYDGNEASAILDANPALENRVCNFPYATTPVDLGNEASVACASANTWGLGKTDDFVGRCRQDAAALDRWVQLLWDYDAEHERVIAGNDAWVTRVQRLRANARSKGLKVVISPRASIRGAKMLAAGWPQDEVERIQVRKGLSDADWRSIQ